MTSSSDALEISTSSVIVAVRAAVADAVFVINGSIDTDNRIWTSTRHLVGLMNLSSRLENPTSSVAVAVGAAVASVV